MVASFEESKPEIIGNHYLMYQISNMANAALKEHRVGCHEVCVSQSYRIESCL